MSGRLHIVPTPVGNLEDMTFRAIRTLKEADLVLAEDTRTSAVLMKHYDIHTPMRSHHRNNEHKAVDGIVEEILGGKDVALVSDAARPASPTPDLCWHAHAATPVSRWNVCPVPRPSYRHSLPPDFPASGSLSRDSCPSRRGAPHVSPNWLRIRALSSSTNPL